MPQHTEKRLEGETLFSGKVFTITRDTVALENGRTSVREVVHHNGGAGIVALNDQGQIALVRQYRYALQQVMTEIPAGKIEPGEPPLQTAVRELEEEVGMRTDSITGFGQLVPTTGYCSEIIHLFFAKNLREGKQNLDKDEFLDVFWLPFEEAVNMALAGELIDSKTVIALLRAKTLYDIGRL